MIRLFLDQPLSAATRVAPTADQARYLTGVMRRGVGDEVLLFNGSDGEWRARLSEASKRTCALEVMERTRAQTGTPNLDLIVALVKRTRLETIVEKAAELGCRRVRLCVTRRTQADHTRVERLQAIAVEASEQTGRLDVPEIVAPERLDRILDAWPAGRRLMFCDEGGEVRPALERLLPEGAPAHRSEAEVPAGDEGLRLREPDHHRNSSPSRPLRGRAPPSPSGRGVSPGWSVLIGPEGGFVPEERERLRSLDFVTPVGLGPRILRADTAAIAALSLWQARLGDWAS